MATPPKPPAAEPPGDVMLEDVLLALQKTFSRLSATTAQRNAEEFRDQARALIVGDVDFEFTVQVAPAEGRGRPCRAGAARHPALLRRRGRLSAQAVRAHCHRCAACRGAGRAPCA
ncbi:hypothetical protein [Ideonella dechloratans]|uniref:hypothetical protein n=1 Tax=Ideonella dechloratans TaxID=36863 RepID=UPI0035B28DF6